MPTEFTQHLLEWYSSHARRLPWREQTDPYAIWISEVMLQQTQVQTVIPYYNRWMERFATVESLAQASEQEVLQAWEGLGYYSRARCLHRAARLIVEQHQSHIPSDIGILSRLPGFGKYTTAAVASIAYNQDEAALDGNIRRVFARVFNLELPTHSREGERTLWNLARQNLPSGKAGQYNQALMDLGAVICTPHKPHCSECPVNSLCQSRLLDLQEKRPIKEQRPPVPHHIVTAALIIRDEKYLIAHRPPNGLLGGLWEFPGGKVDAGETLPGCLKREIQEELGVSVEVGELFGSYKHAYTHFSLTLHAFRCTLSNGEPQALEASELAWVVPAEMHQYPMGKIDRQIARDLLK